MLVSEDAYKRREILHGDRTENVLAQWSLLILWKLYYYINTVTVIPFLEHLNSGHGGGRSSVPLKNSVLVLDSSLSVAIGRLFVLHK